MQLSCWPFQPEPVRKERQRDSEGIKNVLFIIIYIYLLFISLVNYTAAVKLTTSNQQCIDYPVFHQNPCDFLKFHQIFKFVKC